MQMRFGTMITALAALSTLGVMVHADETKISPKDLPPAILKSVKKRFPKAEIENASLEVEEGKTTYEVELEIDDMSVDIAFNSDGAILEIEKEISFKALPARVKKALMKKYPGAKIEKVEEVTRGEDGPTVYEVSLKTEVTMTAKGKVVKAKDDETPSANSKKLKKESDEDDDDDDEDSDKQGEKGSKD